MKKSVPYIIIAILVSVILYQRNRIKVVTEYLPSKTDTVEVVKWDTLTVFKPLFSVDSVIDTIYIESGLKELVTIPKTQRFYSDMYYRAWISGYEPMIDRIDIFSRKEYRTVRVNVYPKTYEFYVNGGFDMIDRRFIPRLGVTLRTPYRFMIGADLNLINGNVGYGLNIGYKLF